MKKLVAVTVCALLLVGGTLAVHAIQTRSPEDDIQQVQNPPPQEVITQEPIKVPDKTYLAPAAKVEDGGTVIDPDLSTGTPVILG